MSRVSTRLARLFDPSDAGIFTLPAEVTALRAATDRLAATTTAEPVPVPHNVMAELTEATKRAAIDGTDLPAASPVLAAEQAQQVEQHRQRIVADAAEQVGEQLLRMVGDLSETIIVTHMRPMYDEVLAGLAKSLALTAEYPDALAALQAPASVRASLAAQPDLYAKYNAIRAAHEVLARVGTGPQRDTEGIFSSMRNAEVIWPRAQRPRMHCPWPDGVSGLAWLIQHDAGLWLPTFAEQDQQYETEYGAREQELLDYHRSAAAMADMFR